MHPISRFKSSSRQTNKSGRDSDAWFERNRSKASGRYPVKRRHSGIGSEPGIDPRDQKHGHFSAKCTIHVTDYSSEHVSSNTLNNAEFVELMKLPQPNPQDERPTLEKSPRLRWINIGGISWDVLSALALRYGSRLFHGLTWESDYSTPMLSSRSNSPLQADYYHQHLFLRVLCHSLPTEGDDNSGPDAQSEYPGIPNEPPANDLEKVTGFAAEPEVKHRRFSALSGFRLAVSEFLWISARQRRILQIAALTKGDRVVVKHDPMFIFLLRDGTVISIHPRPNLEFTEPITERMNQHDSVLRTSEDPAILVEGLLDLIVDRILEVMDEYQDKIHQLEHDILMKPGMSTVRSLHILSGDLIMHKRTLEPIKSMLYGLRRYDQDRCAAMGFGNDTPWNRQQLNSDRHGSDAGLGGYMSYKSKIYLADVYDHMDFVLTSLDMFSGISENLINYAFNMASYEMNQVMRRLTLATIIFLPLTLLTGYFGMNFTSMWSINNNSDVLFWIISLPVLAVVIPMFLYSDIKSMFHYIGKVMTARRAVLAQERASRPW
ncbi:hypothetical protein C8R46DRAFT_882360 [Mycena filopes]|nr:hypothetical protein C8R46DRAFT_882360 [Mycena filopes]